MQKKVRIINKSKDSITLDLGIQIVKATWREFNKMYVICEDNKNYCIINPEWQKRLDEAQKLVNEAMIYYLQVDWKIADPNQIPDPVHIGVVGKYVEEISKILECNYLDAMKLLNYQAIQIRSEFGGPGSFKGLGSDKLPQKQQKNYSTSSTSGNKLSDINPELAKLKEQLQNKERK
jgi:hypothetical protein